MPPERTDFRRELTARACTLAAALTFALGSCARSPAAWDAQLASNDPYERELAAAALGSLPAEHADWTMERLLGRLSDPDARVRERLLAAIDAQIEHAPLTFARGFATADCGDPDVARRMDALARAHAGVLAPVVSPLLAPVASPLLDAREPAAPDRLFFLLLDEQPACLDATISAGGQRAVSARALRERWRSARGLR